MLGLTLWENLFRSFRTRVLASTAAYFVSCKTSIGPLSKYPEGMKYAIGETWLSYFAYFIAFLDDQYCLHSIEDEILDVFVYLVTAYDHVCQWRHYIFAQNVFLPQVVGLQQHG